MPNDYDVFAGLNDFCKNRRFHIQDLELDEEFSSPEREISFTNSKNEKKVEKKTRTKKDLSSPSSSVQSQSIDEDLPTTSKSRRGKKSKSTRATGSETASSKRKAVAQDKQIETTNTQNKSSRARRGGKSKQQTQPTEAETESLTVDIGANCDIDITVTVETQNDNTGPRRSTRLTRQRTRQNNLSETAARSNNVTYVDLFDSPVQSPSPSPSTAAAAPAPASITTDTEIIDLDSPKHVSDTSKSIDLECSFEFENPEISVKIIWKGKPEVFPLRKHQKFAKIFDIFAQRENEDPKNLAFNIDNKFILPTDTPASIDYKIFQFINGRVLHSLLPLQDNVPVKKVKKPNAIMVKIRSEQKKLSFDLEMLKTDKFKIIYIKCAEELGVANENIKLSFDGDPLEYNVTPIDLEFEGGEQIDLQIKK